MRYLPIILTLLLALPALGQTVSPPPGSTTTSLRPQIRADFDRSVDDPRIWVDGVDFTHYVRDRGDTVYLDPPYNLDYGAHQVQVVTREGYQANWSFSIVGPGQARGTYEHPNNRTTNRYPYDYDYDYDYNNRYPDNRYPYDYDYNRYPDNRYPYDPNDNDVDVGEILPYLIPYVLREL